MIEVKNVKKQGYGYEIDNPIKTFQLVGSQIYLNSLKSKIGAIVKWERQGSVYCEKNGHMIDMYFIYVAKTKQANELLRYTIYIDIYYFKDDREKPEDFE